MIEYQRTEDTAAPSPGAVVRFISL